MWTMNTNVVYKEHKGRKGYCKKGLISNKIYIHPEYKNDIGIYSNLWYRVRGTWIENQVRRIRCYVSEEYRYIEELHSFNKQLLKYHLSTEHLEQLLDKFTTYIKVYGHISYSHYKIKDDLYKLYINCLHE